MMLSDLQNKTIVNIVDGKNIGSIIDVRIDEKGVILALVIDPSKGFFRGFSHDEFIVKWNDIARIGEDVILVRVSS